MPKAGVQRKSYRKGEMDYIVFFEVRIEPEEMIFDE